MATKLDGGLYRMVATVTNKMGTFKVTATINKETYKAIVISGLDSDRAEEEVLKGMLVEVFKPVKVVVEQPNK